MSELYVIDEDFVVDFEYYVNLLQDKTTEDPLFVFSKFMELQLKLQSRYSEWSERGRRLSRELTELDSKMRTRLAAKDEGNPLVVEGIKLTQANISAWIEAMPTHQKLKEDLDDVKEKKILIYSIKELVDHCISMIKIEATRNLKHQNLFDPDFNNL